MVIHVVFNLNNQIKNCVVVCNSQLTLILPSVKSEETPEILETEES